MTTIKLTRGKEAIVDAEDFLTFSQWNWQFDGRYATRWQRYGPRHEDRKRKIYLHREILKTVKRIDHKNGNSLDNRKANLRACTQSQNMANKRMQKNNKSGHIGVYWSAKRKAWIATITKDRKRCYYRSFKTADEAAEARQLVAKNLWGEFAYVNNS